MQVFELTYEQNHHRAGSRRPQVFTVTAGFVKDEADAIAHKNERPGNDYFPVEIDDDEAWKI